MPSTDKSKWKPENLLDFLLAGKGHSVLLNFFGGKQAAFQPSELHIQKSIPDRVFWKEDQLTLLELKIDVDSRVCGQLETQRFNIDQVWLISLRKKRRICIKFYLNFICT